jgi:hypothetical protein
VTNNGIDNGYTFEIVGCYAPVAQTPNLAPLHYASTSA